MSNAMEEQRPADMPAIRVHRVNARELLGAASAQFAEQHRAADGMTMMAMKAGER